MGSDGRQVRRRADHRQVVAQLQALANGTGLPGFGPLQKGPDIRVFVAVGFACLQPVCMHLFRAQPEAAGPCQHQAAAAGHGQQGRVAGVFIRGAAIGPRQPHLGGTQPQAAMVGLLHAGQCQGLFTAGQYHHIGIGHAVPLVIDNPPAGRRGIHPANGDAHAHAHRRALQHRLPPPPGRDGGTVGKPDTPIPLGAFCHPCHGPVHRRHAALGPRPVHRLQPPTDFKGRNQVSRRTGTQAAMQLHGLHQQAAAQVEIGRQARMLGNQRQARHRAPQPVARFQHLHLPAPARERFGTGAARQSASDDHHLLHPFVRLGSIFRRDPATRRDPC